MLALNKRYLVKYWAIEGEIQPRPTTCYKLDTALPKESTKGIHQKKTG
jgi:hypothetical protein